ncbi:MAG: type I-C CRISPR-associated protein Cas8c/Csd1 [Halanaerobiales bacterium]
MILEKLCEFAERVDDFPPLHFTKKSIDWLIEIDDKGNLIEFVNVSEEGEIFLYAENLVGRAGRAVKPLLLGDKAKYIFGNTGGTELTNREEKLKKSFYELTEECFVETGLKEVESVLKLLKDYDIKKLVEYEDINDNNWMAFRVKGKDLLKNKKIQEYWQSKQNAVAEERSDMVADCLVCGKEKAIADRHTEKLKLGKIGGHGRGNPLISANAVAFESYGLEESRVAPVCFDCATLYGRTANYLLDKENHNLKIGNIIYLFWTKNNCQFDGFSLLDSPESDEVKSFLKSYKRGIKNTIENEKFYVLALSANNSRTVIRDWINTRLKDIEKNISNYFKEMRLDDNKSDRYYGINTLASNTALNYNDIKPIVAESLAAYALKGSSLVDAVLYNTVKRIKADIEYRVSRPRAALLKMYFNSHPEGGIKLEKKLNKNEKSDAYLCGRLFSVIEIIQKKALPGIKSTIVDRYYGTASAAPASVFGNLLRKAQHHLGKLRKDNKGKGMYYWLQSEIEDIMLELDDFPSSLSLKDQGLFALGYYQQKAYRPEKSKEEKEENNDL